MHGRLMAGIRQRSLANCLRLEQDALQLGIDILEREVDVSRLGAEDVRDLAFNPDVRQHRVLFEEISHVRGQDGDRDDLGCHRRLASARDDGDHSTSGGI